MTYRYIYKITCTQGSFKDKFYFGQRITSKLPENDSYKGSGRMLRDYYKKYTNDYIKEIISYHNTDEELNKAEYDIIKPWLNNDMCLNLKEGGSHGKPIEESKKKMSLAHIGKHLSIETKHKMSINRKGNKNGFKKGHKINEGRIWSEESRKKISEAKKGKTSPMKGKKLKDYMSQEKWDEWRNNLSKSLKGHKPYIPTEDVKKKISETLKGSKWMSNGINRILCKQEECNHYLSLGYHFGMK